MHKLLFIIIFSVYNLNAQIKIPVLSPASKTSQTIGLSNIEIEYSRPSKRNRIIYGENGVLRYNEFWRTGANAATKITFSDDIQIMKTTLKKGSYAILSKPGKTSWEILFYSYQSGNWTTYVTQQPIADFTTKSIILKDVVETFTIYIDQIELDSAQLVFAWGTNKAVLPIRVEVHQKTMVNIEKALSGPSNLDYYQAALYLHEAQKDMDKALTYIQKATNGTNPLFFQVYREALILADLGRKTEAVIVAKKSLKLSQKVGNKDFIRLNEKFIEKWSK